MKKQPPDGALDRAKALRRDMTDAERNLWAILRADGIPGFSFRRQVPIGAYIVDFVCHKARLIIEVDGGQHGPESDGLRTQFLTAEGYRVIRFWNNEVLSNLEGAHNVITENLKTSP